MAGRQGKTAAEVLTQALPGVLGKLAFPRSMRWQTAAAFSRPVRWLLALHGEQVRIERESTRPLCESTRPLCRAIIQGSQSYLFGGRLEA